MRWHYFAILIFSLTSKQHPVPATELWIRKKFHTATNKKRISSLIPFFYLRTKTDSTYYLFRNNLKGYSSLLV
jgi:hypothetical protein